MLSDEVIFLSVVLTNATYIFMKEIYDIGKEIKLTHALHDFIEEDIPRNIEFYEHISFQELYDSIKYQKSWFRKMIDWDYYPNAAPRELYDKIKRYIK